MMTYRGFLKLARLRNHEMHDLFCEEELQEFARYNLEEYESEKETGVESSQMTEILEELEIRLNTIKHFGEGQLESIERRVYKEIKALRKGA